MNSTYLCWADYDNDGWLDVYIICEQQTNRLYHNRGDGSFAEVSERAGVQGSAQSLCKGANWIDYDNGDYPDLFVDNMRSAVKLYHNNRDGTFRAIRPSRWASTVRTLATRAGPGTMTTMAGSTFSRPASTTQRAPGSRVFWAIRPTNLSNRLWHNLGGRKFERPHARGSGPDMMFAAQRFKLWRL